MNKLMICVLAVHLVRSNEITTKISNHLTPFKFCISPSSEYDVSILIEYNFNLCIFFFNFLKNKR